MGRSKPVLRIEVAYVRDGCSYLLPVTLSRAETVRQVIDRSGVLQQCPEIDLQTNKVGIHGKVCTLDDMVVDGNRIEIYRPLRADPKDSRRRRAGKQKKSAQLSSHASEASAKPRT